MSSRARKTFLRGTHRTVSPAATLERVECIADRFGITRMANVTGLDYLGIPVFMAIRPNSRSLSVSQGKGIDDASARASALMEGAELWHAENIAPSLEAASWTEMERNGPTADILLLPRRRGTRLKRDAAIRWAEATDIATGRMIPVPFDLVHVDFRVRRGTTPFLQTTNGLASGNHLLEATCAGLCEAIERDALACWQYRGPKDRAARRLPLESIRDEACDALLERLFDHRVDAAIWNLTTDIDVPVFLCRIAEASDNERSHHGDFWGCGCHSSREIALVRAITEAAQTRLTYIAGSRDDLQRRHYATPQTGVLDVALNLWELARSETTFGSVPGANNAGFEQDLAELIHHLGAADLQMVLRVDLTNSLFGIPVVRIIVPGLETWTGEGVEAAGPRARAVQESRQ